MIRILPLALIFSFTAHAVDSPLVYTDTNSVQARRNLEKILARDPRLIPEAEGVEWVRARFALIALLRLQGKESEALGVFEKCEEFCKKWGPTVEWDALVLWGCDRLKKAAVCRKR